MGRQASTAIRKKREFPLRMLTFFRDLLILMKRKIRAICVHLRPICVTKNIYELS
jgi:hypothetical protein